MFMSQQQLLFFGVTLFIKKKKKVLDWLKLKFFFYIYKIKKFTVHIIFCIV